jgi:hypothetical protein
MNCFVPTFPSTEWKSLADILWIIKSVRTFLPTSTLHFDELSPPPQVMMHYMEHPTLSIVYTLTR